MNMRKIMANLLVAAGLMVLAGGCATAGYQKAERTAISMDDAQLEMRNAYGQVTIAVKALDALMQMQAGDLRPAYQEFVTGLKALEPAAEAVRIRAISMQQHNRDYFLEWAKEIELIQDPDIKAQSTQRYAETMARYQKVEQMLFKTRDVFRPMLNSLQSLQLALNNDLTQAGVAALRPSYEKARKQAVDLQAVMRTTMDAIQSAANQMTPQAAKQP